MKKYKVMTGIFIKSVPINPGDIIELNSDDAVVLLGYKLIEPHVEELEEIQSSSSEAPQKEGIKKLVKQKGGKKNGKVG